MGGTSCGCFQDITRENEFTVQITHEDLPKITALQSILRGYMERKKIVGLTKLRFAKTQGRRQKRPNNIVVKRN